MIRRSSDFKDYLVTMTSEAHQDYFDKKEVRSWDFIFESVRGEEEMIAHAE